MSLCYEARAEASLSVGYTRAQVPVWSLNDQPAGGRNTMTIKRNSGTRETHQFASGITLQPGDQVIIETANGGNA